MNQRTVPRDSSSILYAGSRFPDNPRLRQKACPDASGDFGVHASGGPDDLLAGETLSTPNGQTETVVGTTSIAETQGVLVYNFTVADDHTYFVEGFGNNGTTGSASGSLLDAVWVHNTCVPQVFEISTYGDSRGGGSLVKHELLQFGWLKNNSLVMERGLGAISRMNPVVYLSTAMHDAVNDLQRFEDLFDSDELATMSPLENIQKNVKILKTVGVPPDVVEKLTEQAMAFIQSMGL